MDNQLPWFMHFQKSNFLVALRFDGEPRTIPNHLTQFQIKHDLPMQVI